MDEELMEKAFDSNMDGSKKNLRVHVINPTTENPWRTRKEYIEEREKLLALQERQIEALDAIKKSSWQQTVAFIVTVFVSTATIVATAVAVLTYLKPSA